MGAGGMRRAGAALLWVVLLAAVGGGSVCEAQLRRGYYAGVCPNVESIVRGVVAQKMQQTPATVGATVRLFFHDCFVEGCDASVMVASAANNTAEKDHPINLSMACDGFDTVIRARAAVDASPGCRGKVSCTDVLAMATRDAIALMKYLEEWSFLERDHAHSLSGSTQALTATVLRLPVSNGAMADIQGIRNALSSAVDVMHTIENSTRTQLPKLARTNVLVSQLSRVFIQEHILMVQCRDLLSTLASMHVTYSSLQGQRIQLNQTRPSWHFQ